MGVLDVVDGILGRLAAREVEVEVDHRVVGAREHEVARCVDADFGEELVERDELAAALGHRSARTAFDDVHELQHRDLEPLGVHAQGRDVGLHPRDVAVVVRAERDDHQVEAALELVLGVGDVGREVRRLAGRALEDAVLVVAELGRTQPQRALGAIEVALLRQALDPPLDRARLALVQHGSLKKTSNATR